MVTGFPITADTTWTAAPAVAETAPPADPTAAPASAETAPPADPTAAPAVAETAPPTEPTAAKTAGKRYFVMVDLSVSMLS